MLKTPFLSGKKNEGLFFLSIHNRIQSNYLSMFGRMTRMYDLPDVIVVIFFFFFFLCMCVCVFIYLFVDLVNGRQTGANTFNLIWLNCLRILTIATIFIHFINQTKNMCKNTSTS